LQRRAGQQTGDALNSAAFVAALRAEFDSNAVWPFDISVHAAEYAAQSASRTTAKQASRTAE
jgi:hypothetical protein